MSDDGTADATPRGIRDGVTALRGSDGSAPAVSLGALLRDVPGPVRLLPGDGASAVPVRGIAAHSREVRPGFCFVAVRGTLADGHEFVEEALSRRAAAVVVDRPEVGERVAQRAQGVAVAVVADSRLALAWMAAAYYRHPSRELSVIGVTGTVGKTSTALFLRHLLEGSGRPSGAIGSLGIYTRRTTLPSALTTPDPLTLQAALRAMADEGLRFATVEVSSHALLQRRAASVRLRAAVLTELLPYEHRDFHPTFRHYLRVKAGVLDLLEPEATVIYSAANRHSTALASRWPAERRVAYALADGSDAAPGGRPAAPARGWGGQRARPARRGEVVGQVLGVGLDGTELVLSGGMDGRVLPAARVHVSLLGPHAAANALGAAAAALALGVEPEALLRGLATLRPLRRRMEVVYRGAFTVIDDTTGHPASFERLFSTLLRCGVDGVVLLVGVRGNRGAEINARNGRAVARWSHRLPVEAIVVTDAEEAVSEANRARPEERAALLRAMERARVRPVHVPTLEQAVGRALEAVRPGGVLVLAGAQALDQGASLVRRQLRAGPAR